MSTVDAVAAVLWVGVTAYAVLGGADFGAGFWSLFAGRGERGRRSRELVDWAIGPVWEANHVWLIFVLVVLWTAFSSAFAAIFSTLFIPLSLAALGIVLRGAGFAFHKTAGGLRERALATRLFGLSSLLTPFFMGTVAGAVAGGRVPVGNAAGDQVTSWLNPLSVIVGALFVATVRLPRRRVPRERGTSGGHDRPPASLHPAGDRDGDRGGRARARGPHRPARRRARALRRADERRPPVRARLRGLRRGRARAPRARRPPGHARRSRAARSPP